jgi:hypothetical protein
VAGEAKITTGLPETVLLVEECTVNPYLIAAFVFWANDAPRKAEPLKARPTAMVLRVSGKATAEGRIGTRAIEVGDYLLPGEKVTTDKDAELLLLFLVRAERHLLKGDKPITLTNTFCEPADAVEKAPGVVPLKKANLSKVREVEVREGGGVGVVRGEKPTTEARVEPLFGTFVMTLRPSFRWPPVEKAEGYHLELREDGGKLLWKATSKEPALAFPKKEKPLQYTQKYLWSVKAILPDREAIVVDSSKFTLLFDGEPQELEPVKKLAEGTTEEELLLAAAAYEGYGVLDEVLKLFEKLARLQPKVARYHLALARYYEHAGRKDKGKEEREKASQLAP